MGIRMKTPLLLAIFACCLLQLSSCGSSACEKLAEKICECANATPEMCIAAEEYAKTAEDDHSGMREHACGRVNKKFDCHLPEFITAE